MSHTEHVGRCSNRRRLGWLLLVTGVWVGVGMAAEQTSTGASHASTPDSAIAQHADPEVGEARQLPLPRVTSVTVLTQNGGRVDWSPQGDLIAFDRLGDDGYYDIWVMRADGAAKRRLTFFNDPASPQFIPGRVVASDVSVSPDGLALAAFLQDNISRTHAGSIVLLELDASWRNP